MRNSKEAPVSTFEEFFESFEQNVLEKLLEMRATISSAAPGAREIISYAIPTYVLNGNLVHFAAFKNLWVSIRGPWEYKI